EAMGQDVGQLLGPRVLRGGAWGCGRAGLHGHHASGYGAAPGVAPPPWTWSHPPDVQRARIGRAKEAGPTCRPHAPPPAPATPAALATAWPTGRCGASTATATTSPTSRSPTVASTASWWSRSAIPLATRCC